MGISMWQLLIILLSVLLRFGDKKLRGLGGDLGGAVKGFREAMGEEKDKDETPAQAAKAKPTEQLESQASSAPQAAKSESKEKA